jgi:translocation and assembly module TamB
MAATQLKNVISNNLPLDVFSIEAGDEGIAGTKLEAGTYINDDFYVGFQGRLGADPMQGENANAVRLEYQLSKRWSLEAEYGDARSGSADLIWTKEY